MNSKVCAIEGCSRKKHSRGWCHTHYARWRRLGEPDASVRRHAVDVSLRDENGNKHCIKCLGWYPESEFYAAKKLSDGLETRCKACNAKELRNWKYSVDVEALLQAHEYKCSICERNLEVKSTLAVDHDHSCCPGGRSCGKCVRGLLCRKCNAALGAFGDDPKILLRAIEYLDRWSVYSGGGDGDE